MNTPKWLKPGLYGAAIGAITLATVGFSWGGWVTGHSANRMASDEAQAQVVAALAPICVMQSKQDPQYTQTLAALQDTASYKRRDIVMAAGWATMPGSTDPDRAVATACMETLAAQF